MTMCIGKEKKYPIDTYSISALFVQKMNFSNHCSSCVKFSFYIVKVRGPQAETSKSIQVTRELRARLLARGRQLATSGFKEGNTCMNFVKITIKIQKYNIYKHIIS